MSDPRQGRAEEQTEVRPEGHSPAQTRRREARFTPGTMVAGRYRVVSLLGEGGSGEVYRADDTKLGQRVALKYVPSAVDSDPVLLERLLSEVRIGRQISHPNVCRLYDVVDVDGDHFITMEYVDGEDLASLLRRIGRLPPDKALALAKDICAGLAAAHDLGVVHRDLKPGNILVDGRGTARITDFGLAGLVEDLRGSRDFSGTPAYMAPEQLTGGESTVRSDLYGLGLILYEMFTGRKVFDGRSVAAIREQHSTAKTRPSSLVSQIDPAVERVILRCLEEAPSDRPPSAHAIMAALPGGDPLQAAIAAGETPSPEMVAAAGKTGEIPAPLAWALLAGLALALLAAWMVLASTSLPGVAAPPKSRDALTDRARDVVRAFGYAEDPRDEDVRWVTNRDYLDSIMAKPAAESWNQLSSTPPSAVWFGYRASPVRLRAANEGARVLAADPAEDVPGMASVILDSEGRLVEFRRVPPLTVTARPGNLQWNAGFEAAGLRPADFEPAQTQWLPPHGAEARFAWTGRHSLSPDLPIRVEAASVGGRAVWFRVIEPWSRTIPGAESPSGLTVLTALWIAGLAGAAVFARRNIRAGRGDRRGARRLAIYIFCVGMMALLSVADHAMDLVAEWDVLTRLMQAGLFFALQVWLIYMAIEPYVRRRWPHMLIAWSRLLEGRVRDALVGRDVLIGGIAGAASITVGSLAPLVSRWLGLPAAEPLNQFTHLSMDHAAGFGFPLFYYQFLGAVYALGWLILLILIRLVVKRYVLSLMILTLLVAAVNPVRSPVDALIAVVSVAIPVYTLHRFGLLALAVGFYYYYVLMRLPFGFDLSAWYSTRAVLGMSLLFIAGAYGFYRSLGGRPLFGRAALEDEVLSA